MPVSYIKIGRVICDIKGCDTYFDTPENRELPSLLLLDNAGWYAKRKSANGSEYYYICPHHGSILFRSVKSDASKGE